MLQRGAKRLALAAAARGGAGARAARDLPSTPATTSYSTTSGPEGLAQQVVDYARALVADEKQKEQQTGGADVASARRRALDALLSVAPALASSNLPLCRVLLAASDAHACLGEWAEASREAGRALDAALQESDGDDHGGGTAPLLRSAAALAAVRAALVAGDDAGRLASSAGAVVLPGLGDLVTIMSAAKADESAATDECCPLVMLARGRRHVAAAMRAAAASADAKAAAAAAAPHTDAALPALERCAELAEKMAGEGDAAADNASFSRPLWLEVAADARCAQGQAAAAARRWPDAEERLSAAVKLGEAAAGGDARAPGLVAPLTLLGDVYARTARVMFAEGMYREAARLAGVEAAIGGGGRGGGGGEGGGGGGDGSSSGPSSSSSSAGGPRVVHPSLGALAAWRYAQLLTALPKRETEAKAWAAAAGRLWGQQQRRRDEEGGGGGSGDKHDLAPLLGALDCRTGKSASREGGIVSLLCRRLFVVEGA
jgi:hypothetical protein